MHPFFSVQCKIGDLSRKNSDTLSSSSLVIIIFILIILLVMLSQEIYDSWNADLKDYFGGPHIPGDDVQKTAFKAAVLKKIEKRRVAERRKSHDRDFDFLNYDESGARGCCGCLKKKSRLPKICDCKSLSMFEGICTATKKQFTKSISAAKALIQKLSYWESIKPGTDGLSVVGGYVWLLSYACQHLIDSPQSREEFKMQSHIHEVKELYQVLAQAGELFLDMSTSFHENTFNMRLEGLSVLKKLTKKWKIDDHYNPLSIRLEAVKTVPRPRKTLGNGLDSPIDIDDDDDVFSVKWSPLVVYIQLGENDKSKPFGKLHPQDRVTVFRKFLKYTLTLVEMAAEDVTAIARGLQDIEVQVQKSSSDSTDQKMEAYTGRELTAAMLEFAKSSFCPKALEEKDKKRLIVLLNEFWYSLDVLYENIFILLRLVEETRDIIRTCYVYVDIFYKWHMPSYDCFMSPKPGGGKQRRRSSVVPREVLKKFSPSEKKLSETTSILSLMDFSSSIYQGVVQEIPVQCEGMQLLLRSHDSDSATEPMGLVSGIVDKRKSRQSFDF